MIVDTPQAPSRDQRSAKPKAISADGAASTMPHGTAPMSTTGAPQSYPAQWSFASASAWACGSRQLIRLGVSASGWLDWC